jgi:hypothetical protein
MSHCAPLLHYRWRVDVERDQSVTRCMQVREVALIRNCIYIVRNLWSFCTKMVSACRDNEACIKVEANGPKASQNAQQFQTPVHEQACEMNEWPRKSTTFVIAIVAAVERQPLHVIRMSFSSMNIATISSAVCAPPNCPATPTSIFSRRSPTSFALKVKAETTALCAPSARAAAIVVSSSSSKLSLTCGGPGYAPDPVAIGAGRGRPDCQSRPIVVCETL